jgi:hypothetical protein
VKLVAGHPANFEWGSGIENAKVREGARNGKRYMFNPRKTIICIETIESIQIVQYYAILLLNDIELLFAIHICS